MKKRRRHPSPASRAAREQNVCDAATMLIMLRHDYIGALDKIDTALKLLIGRHAVRELQQKERERAR